MVHGKAQPRTTRPKPAESPGTALARNLVIARDLLGMTQHDLASRSGVSRATIAQIESGFGDPRLSTISQLAGALGVPVLVLVAVERDVQALAGIGPALAANPVAIDVQDQARMTALAQSPVERDRRRAARIGSSVARAAGCKSPGAAATAGLFSVVAPGQGTAVGTTLGRLLE